MVLQLLAIVVLQIMPKSVQVVIRDLDSTSARVKQSTNVKKRMSVMPMLSVQILLVLITAFITTAPVTLALAGTERKNLGI